MKRPSLMPPGRRTRQRIAWSVLIAGIVGAEYVWMCGATGRGNGEAAASVETKGLPVELILPDFGQAAEPILAIWDEPERQARGEGWVFDVFTPPDLYRNPATWAWSLTPPPAPDLESDASTSTEESVFAIEVLAIVREPFPVQLVGFGHQEGGGSYGVFENTLSGETLLGRQGETLNGMNYRVERLEVVRMRVGSPELGTYPVMAAKAVVVETTTGATNEVDSLARTYVGEPWIHYRTRRGPESAVAERFVTIHEGGANYRVLAIEVEDAAVEVVKEAVAGNEPQSRRFSVPVIASRRPLPGSEIHQASAGLSAFAAEADAGAFPPTLNSPLFQ